MTLFIILLITMFVPTTLFKYNRLFIPTSRLFKSLITINMENTTKSLAIPHPIDFPELPRLPKLPNLDDISKNIESLKHHLNETFAISTLIQEDKRTTIQYMSDIHADTRYNVIKFPDVVPKCPTLIIAGDVGTPYNDKFYIFIKRMSQRFDTVLFVAGNHEYESGCLFDQHKYLQIKPILKQVLGQFSNVHFLDNSVYKLNDRVVIAGTTLWSMPMFKPTETDISRAINHIEQHNKCIKFIENTCKEYKNNNIVMVSHYVPTFKLIEPRYTKHGKFKGSWFCTDLEHLIKSPMKAWICGHSHSVISADVNDVFCGINAYGYPHENSSNWIEPKTFTI